MTCLFPCKHPGPCLLWGDPQIIVFILPFLLSQIYDSNFYFFFFYQESVEGLSDEIFEDINVVKALETEELGLNPTSAIY